jgi:putative membrane protein
VMMIEESILTLSLFCWLFLRTARQGEERQELLDYASSHGLQLTDERATRAVGAGRGGALRRRLEEDAAETPLSSSPAEARRARFPEG